MSPWASNSGAAELQHAKAAAALPVHRRADAALLACDHFGQARQAMRDRVLAHLDADPLAAHLVRDGGGGAAAEEAVEDEVGGVGGDCDDLGHETLRFWRRKQVQP
jgi:hypothetical protein